MSFKDYFSSQASNYAKYRVAYPRSLFEYLASLVPERRLAWDCATGSGQAAIELASFFERVVATDGSPEQIENAKPRPNIIYRVALAEQSGLERGSVDLITVATAIHWLNLEKFYAEVRRVARKKAVLATFSYYHAQVDSAIERILHHFARQVLSEYWPHERQLSTTLYQDLPFPFLEFKAPLFEARAQWNFDQLLGYINTWSATQMATTALGKSPIEGIRAELTQAWGDPSKKFLFRWPLFFRIGHVH